MIFVKVSITQRLAVYVVDMWPKMKEPLFSLRHVQGGTWGRYIHEIYPSMLNQVYIIQLLAVYYVEKLLKQIELLHSQPYVRGPTLGESIRYFQ